MSAEFEPGIREASVGTVVTIFSWLGIKAVGSTAKALARLEERNREEHQEIKEMIENLQSRFDKHIDQ